MTENKPPTTGESKTFELFYGWRDITYVMLQLIKEYDTRYSQLATSGIIHARYARCLNDAIMEQQLRAMPTDCGGFELFGIHWHFVTEINLPGGTEILLLAHTGLNFHGI